MSRPQLPDWRGRAVVIVASGPSASQAPIEIARDRTIVVVVNESWRLAPWADVLFSADVSWWHLTQGWLQFAGRKFTTSRSVAVAFPGLVERVLPGYAISSGANNSGFLALLSAVSLGARDIALAGFDYHIDEGVHWHGPHPAPLRNPSAATIARWRAFIEAEAAKLSEAGVNVVNVCQRSALSCFRKTSLQEFIDASPHAHRADRTGRGFADQSGAVTAGAG